MTTDHSFKRGDLIGVNIKEETFLYVIAQVVKYNRFFYCKDLLTNEYHFVVFDPVRHFLVCPEFDLDIRPDIDVVSMGAEFYGALDKLFGFSEEDSDEW